MRACNVFIWLRIFQLCYLPIHQRAEQLLPSQFFLYFFVLIIFVLDIKM